ncbi:BCAS3 microtubule associated cell migration factor-like isoform X2 [Watersipora subatra]|uniref:BCAS3 microtubule associated cell migration factor-like isoform X2 n=1 Tax=Watersipora subatra TaxID=2589382 RepID=UPI00355B814E
MAAGVLKKCSTNAGFSATYVDPVPISEKSALASVMDFVTEVVPQTASCPEDKDQIIWVKLEQLSQPVAGDRPDDQSTPTVLIIIGYTNGVQIWQLLHSGKAQEMISLRQGPIKVYTILHRVGQSHVSMTSDYLIASTDESTQSLTPYATLKLTSLVTKEEVWKHSFKNTINDIHYNSKLLLITFSLKVAAFDLFSFKPLFTVSGCFPAEGPNPNPVSLGSAWLAYADCRIVGNIRSHGDFNSTSATSYTATVLNTAKTVAKGVSTIGESLMSNFTGSHKPHRGSGSSSPGLSPTPGVVTVLNCDQLSDHFTLDGTCCGPEVICHFQACLQPVAMLKFDYSGTLLFTACTEGQNFHIYQLTADMYGSSQAGVQHLYTLHRGDTTAQVMDVTFTLDSRWVAVCTARGTTHLFPICPYGGKATARTHVNQYVVNKATKYEKSSGLEEVIEPAVVDKLSSPTLIDSVHSTYLKYNNGAMENPVLKSYSECSIVEPVYQIKSPEWSSHCASRRHIPNRNIAACFARSRGRKRRHSFGLKALQASESLYILSDSGDLLQYRLEPSPDGEFDQITDTTPLNLYVITKAKWPLGRTYAHKERPYYSADSGLEKYCTHYGSKESISSDTGSNKSGEEGDDEWLAQVEMVTCSGPNRRLWMGPQFKFKTYNTNSVVVFSQSPALFPSITSAAAADMNCDSSDLESLQFNNHRTQPMNTPAGPKQQHVFAESGKQQAGSLENESLEAGSFDSSPRVALTEPIFDSLDFDELHPSVESLTSQLADAMQDQRISPGDLMMFSSN